MPPVRTPEGGVLNWASDIDPRALEQAERTSRLPFVPGPVRSWRTRPTWCASTTP
jgi:hypothetical protein